MNSKVFTEQQHALLQLAKQPNPERRRWIPAKSIDPYDTDTNRVWFWVLEGSPARGFIILTQDNLCVRLDEHGRLIKQVRIEDN